MLESIRVWLESGYSILLILMGIAVAVTTLRCLWITYREWGKDDARGNIGSLIGAILFFLLGGFLFWVGTL